MGLIMIIKKETKDQICRMSAEDKRRLNDEYNDVVEDCELWEEEELRQLIKSGKCYSRWHNFNHWRLVKKLQVKDWIADIKDRVEWKLDRLWHWWFDHFEIPTMIFMVFIVPTVLFGGVTGWLIYWVLPWIASHCQSCP